MMQDETARSRRVLPLFGIFVCSLAVSCGDGSVSDLFSSTNLGAAGSNTRADAGASGTSDHGGVAGNSAGSGFGGELTSGAGGTFASAGAGAGDVGAAGVAGVSASAGASSGGVSGTSGFGGSNAGVGGGGAANGSGGAGPLEPSACDSRLVKPAALVSDFERGVAGWLGYIDDNPAPVIGVAPGANGTLHAAGFVGGAAKISGMYFQIPCRDVSDFDGISFWGKSAGTARVRFLAVIPKTDPTPGIGDCDPAQETCSDHPGKAFTFGPNWALYSASWSELKQLGFGAKAPFADVVNALLWINDGPVDHFDFSIDEVNFYRGDSGY